MGIDAFVIRDTTEGLEFAETFLKSPDFTNAVLANICKTLGVSSSGNKEWLINNIIQALEREPKYVSQIIIEQLVSRKRKWLAIKMGKVKQNPECADPTELVQKIGEGRWYGPVQSPRDENAQWYIRPVSVRHFEARTRDDVQRYSIRWLCFARIDSENISIHWEGFSHTDLEDKVNKNSQNQYWLYIPGLFTELERLTQSEFRQPNLQHLILQKMWNEYKLDKEHYIWDDRRIRAEAGGVSLNARASAKSRRKNRTEQDIDVEGIKRLARTLRNSIESELEGAYDYKLPNPEDFDEVILRTMIKDFGPLSYEFDLADKEDELLFNGHIFFGAKPQQGKVDSFPHIRVYITYHDDLQLLDFILKHLEVDDEDNSQSEQLPLL
ncbi:MAG: hypothetical protein GY803_02925 [Chloroflexi bacterium]|nr:hypothetical protein [Chloroflexota bacterium]